MNKKKVVIAFRPGPVLSHHEMQDFQEDLKILDEEDYQKLRGEIVDTGFAFSPHVWKDPADGSWKIVDAHQRKKVLGRLEAEGYEIPKFHTIEVLADDYATAKRRVLQGTSQYGRMTERGLFEFSKKAGISFEGLGGFRFPDIKLKALAAQFSPPVPPDGAKELGGELFVGLNCRCPKCGFEFEAKK